MKRILLFVFFTVFTMSCFAQVLDKYSVTVSYPLERIMIHFNKEIDNKDFIDLGSGDYLAPIPHKDQFVVRFTADTTKAIVIQNSYAFGRHFEFDVQDNEKRLVLYYKDKNTYCGYIYDKKYKVCKYFESKKEFNRFMKHPPFIPIRR